VFAERTTIYPYSLEKIKKEALMLYHWWILYSQQYRGNCKIIWNWHSLWSKSHL